MSESNAASTERKPLLTVRNIVRMLALFCIVFVFCPSFMVSCSGQTMEVDVTTAIQGVTMYGETIVKPVPAMLVCLLLPIAVFAILSIKKWNDAKTAIMTFVCTGIDLVVWIVFYIAVKKLAEENYCSFKATGWYTFNLIVLIAMGILSLFVMIRKLSFDSVLANAGTQDALSQMSTAITQMSATVTQLAGNAVDNAKQKKQKVEYIGYCAKCGSGIEFDCKFCVNCGTPVPKAMIEEAIARKEVEEKAKLEAEEKARQEAEAKASEAEPENGFISNIDTESNHAVIASHCQNCGAELSVDAKFCESCGAKVK